MATFISHNRISADSPKNAKRVSYLSNDSISKQIETIMSSYFQQHPEGEEVTLEVFKGIGSLQGLAQRFGKTVFSLKQDLGLLVSIKGEHLFGKACFQTLRNASTGKNSIRRVPVKIRSTLGLENYTPHRISRNSNIGDLFGCIPSTIDGVEVQNEMRSLDLQ